MAMPSPASLHRQNPRRSTTPPLGATTNDGDLPLDLLYEILVRLPAEPICRFRAVCRSWRSLLCHPDFIAAAHKPGPLLAIGMEYYPGSNEVHVHVLDMESGDAVKDVRIAANDAFLSPSPYGEVCIMSDDCVICMADLYGRQHLLDLVSGAVSVLPDHATPLVYMSPSPSSVIVGFAASTAEHKVLDIANSLGYNEHQVCRIATFGFGRGSWRETESPPLKVEVRSGRLAVINGVAYFLSSYTRIKQGMYAHNITSFDFNTERWRPITSSLQGPANCAGITLAELDSHLVASHAVGYTSIELWFLMDLDRSFWSKRYTITMPCYKNEYFDKPLTVLDDGRIVLLMQVQGQTFSSDETMLRIYNPRTKTFKDGMRVPRCKRVIVLRWNLLHSWQTGQLDIAARQLLLARRHHQSGATFSCEGPSKERQTSNMT